MDGTSTEEDPRELPFRGRTNSSVAKWYRSAGAFAIGFGTVLCIFGGSASVLFQRADSRAEHMSKKQQWDMEMATDPKGLEFGAGMLSSLDTLVAQDIDYEPYCRDTPMWANGFDCISQRRTAEDGCTPRGWSCAGYAVKKHCANGQRKSPPMNFFFPFMRRDEGLSFGRRSRFPELNCCVCGGGEASGGACIRLGCSTLYRRTDPCQCNADCKQYNNCCYDYEATCVSKAVTGYRPFDTSLLRASDAPALTFYMYRAQTAETFPPTNVNTASLGAVIWYLHNEIVWKCPRRGTIVSKSDITRIIRYKVTTKATTPLFNRGMNFGVKSSYDYGASTGPGNRNGEDWSMYGYFVGCVAVGHWPHESFKSAMAYPQPYWYSLPGQCPNEDIEHKHESCKQAEPGGFCKEPTGAGNCTYTFEEAGEIDIDELVGITPRWSNHAEFCRQGCKEYDASSDRGQCLHWWDHKWSRDKNLQRVRRADELFGRRYPDMPRDSDLPPPPCDFDRENFYRDFVPKPP